MWQVKAVCALLKAASWPAPSGWIQLELLLRCTQMYWVSVAGSLQIEITSVAGTLRLSLLFPQTCLDKDKNNRLVKYLYKINEMGFNCHFLDLLMLMYYICGLTWEWCWNIFNVLKTKPPEDRGQCWEVCWCQIPQGLKTYHRKMWRVCLEHKSISLEILILFVFQRWSC